MAHFACEQFEKGQTPARMVVRVVLGSSPLFFVGQDLQEKKVIGTVAGFLTLPSKLVGKSDQGDRGHRIGVAAVVAERDVHRACSIENFFGKVFEPRFTAKFCREPLKGLLADEGNNVYGVS